MFFDGTIKLGLHYVKLDKLRSQEGLGQAAKWRIYRTWQH